MKKFLATAAVMGIMAAGLFAQTPEAERAPGFEVASIKPSAAGGHGMSISTTKGGRFTTENVPLRNLIMFAYDVRSFQITGGPGWLTTDGWDISAKPEGEMPSGPEGGRRIRAMLQTLLAERFKLVVHTETKEMPVYALVVGKNGPRLQVSPEGAKGPSMSSGKGQMKMTKGTMAMLAQSLSNQLGRTVFDETGLKGDFDMKLEFAPDQNGPAKPVEGPENAKVAAESDGPSLFTALQEQLGLRLEGKKGPVQIVVIDKAEKVTEN
jgi:bla regulator protein BlaR1